MCLIGNAIRKRNLLEPLPCSPPATSNLSSLFAGSGGRSQKPEARMVPKASCKNLNKVILANGTTKNVMSPKTLPATGILRCPSVNRGALELCCSGVALQSICVQMLHFDQVISDTSFIIPSGRCAGMQLSSREPERSRRSYA